MNNTEAFIVMESISQESQGRESLQSEIPRSTLRGMRSLFSSITEDACHFGVTPGTRTQELQCITESTAGM